ncbi:MAG: DUF192 domain-containing protein [Sphingomonadales bacterium]
MAGIANALRNLAIGLLVLFLIAASAAWAQPATPQSLPQSPLVIETAAQAQHAFTVELANTPQTRAVGLMHRTALAADQGMLFDFGAPRPVSMWMKNTLISLDMLFIQSDGRIVNIAADTTPHSLQPVHSRGRVKAVLELPAGTAKALAIAPGDIVRHAIFDNAPTLD